jgi:hypothetical protein
MFQILALCLGFWAYHLTLPRFIRPANIRPVEPIVVQRDGAMFQVEGAARVGRGGIDYDSRAVVEDEPGPKGR